MMHGKPIAVGAVADYESKAPGSRRQEASAHTVLTQESVPVQLTRDHGAPEE
jgi:hypothetical protein